MAKTTSTPQSHRRARKNPFFVILVFLAMMLAGIATGEPDRVLEQAIQICLGCIGIG